MFLWQRLREHARLYETFLNPYEPIQERAILMLAEVRSGHCGVLSSPAAVSWEAGGRLQLFWETVWA